MSQSAEQLAAAEAHLNSPLPPDSQGRDIAQRILAGLQIVAQLGLTIPSNIEVLEANLARRSIRVTMPDSSSFDITLGRLVSTDDDILQVITTLRQLYNQTEVPL